MKNVVIEIVIPKKKKLHVVIMMDLVDQNNGRLKFVLEFGSPTIYGQRLKSLGHAFGSPNP